jgi:ssRNA-specific RNase YbeY (16S rRNA maturation enzyme)
VVAAAGLPFALSRPQQRLKFKWARRVPGYSIADLQVEVDALQEGQPAGMSARQVAALLAQLEQDAALAVPLALAAKQEAQPGYRLPAIANLSLVLCDDAHIQALNRQHRGMDAPTDVLSFELPDESPALQLPVKLLGDLVVSLDTAARQAQERGCACACVRVCVCVCLACVADRHHARPPATHAPPPPQAHAHAHTHTHTHMNTGTPC